MTARVPDGEQPVGGEGPCSCWQGVASHTYAADCWLHGHLADAQPPRPRPAEPTVDGLAELEALRAVVARVEALASELEEAVETRLMPDALVDPRVHWRTLAAELRRALDGDGG